MPTAAAAAACARCFRPLPPPALLLAVVPTAAIPKLTPQPGSPCLPIPAHSRSPRPSHRFCSFFGEQQAGAAAPAPAAGVELDGEEDLDEVLLPEDEFFEGEEEEEEEEEEGLQVRCAGVPLLWGPAASASGSTAVPVGGRGRVGWLLPLACPRHAAWHATGAPASPFSSVTFFAQVSTPGALDKGEEFDLMSRLQGLRTGSRR